MSIRQVNCPGCGATANVPIAMTNVKCPGCATVWNVNNPAAAQVSAAAREAASDVPTSEEQDKTTAHVALIAGLVGGAMLMMAMFGLAIIILNRDYEPSASTELEETIKPREPEEYREIRLPEATRRRIYKDYRTVARTSVEKPLPLPQGTRARQSLENTLQLAFDRELKRFAALHDVSVDDIQEVIKEGDAKAWDESPRSNAVRDGKRVYAKEKSEGWKRNPNRK